MIGDDLDDLRAIANAAVVRRRSGWNAAAAGLLIALGLLGGALAGCAVVTAPQAPGAMNVSIEIQYFQQGNSHISVGFSDAKLNPVEFVSGETVACNGQFLRYSAGHYIGDVPKQPDTGAYTITYTPARGTGSAAGDVSPISIAVKVVNAPVAVTAPQPGATVLIPATAPLRISYQPIALDNTRINAIAADGRGHLTFTLPEVESGAIAMSADNFTQFQGGPGVLTITRETTDHPIGAPFRSVDTHFKNVTQVAIVWQ
jgi:hypothetical protein